MWTLSGYDVVTHAVEKTYDAGRNVPRAMVWSSRNPVFLGLISLNSLAICATDIDSLTGTARGPVYWSGTGGHRRCRLLEVNFIVKWQVAFVSHLQSHVSKQQTLTPIFLNPVCLRLAHLRLQTRRGPPRACLARSAASPSAHIRRTTPLLPYSCSRLPLAPSPSATIAPSGISFCGSTLAGQLGYVFPGLWRCLYEDNSGYKNRPHHLGRRSKTVRRVAVG